MKINNDILHSYLTLVDTHVCYTTLVHIPMPLNFDKLADTKYSNNGNVPHHIYKHTFFNIPNENILMKVLYCVTYITLKYLKCFGESSWISAASYISGKKSQVLLRSPTN